MSDEPGPHEVYCSSCGEVIKEEAEICPECGVKNKVNEDSSSSGTSVSRKVQLEKIASKDKTTVLLLGFFITPLGYYWLGKTGLALVNLFTFNYFLTGPIVVPLHCNKIMNDAQKELDNM